MYIKALAYNSNERVRKICTCSLQNSLALKMVLGSSLHYCPLVGSFVLYSHAVDKRGDGNKSRTARFLEAVILPYINHSSSNGKMNRS
eukprot:1485984-Pleurochrysis_carterae.AAC.1